MAGQAAVVRGPGQPKASEGHKAFVRAAAASATTLELKQRFITDTVGLYVPIFYGEAAAHAS